MRRALLESRELAVVIAALAVGLALFELLRYLSTVVIDVVGQLVNEPYDEMEGFFTPTGPTAGRLAARIAGVDVFYGFVVSALLTLLLIAALAAFVRRLQRRCPHCRSVIARDASVCAACSLDLEPGAAA